MTIFKTREEWLVAAKNKLKPHFKEADAPLHDNIRISVGFAPRGFEKIAGICFRQMVSKDKKNEIFISPMVDSPTEALAILVHELAHAQDDCASGHGKAFKRLVDKLSLEGKPTATTAGPTFKQRYENMLRQLGDYPHRELRPTKIKKQGTRLIKCECKECGYIARTTKTWIESAGAPICPTCEEPMAAETE